MERAHERPSRFFLHGKRYTVEQAYGPWRKSGDWWSAELWSREEWDVVARTSEDEVLLCVVDHDLLSRTWQLDALYD
jgi:protein ImuB